MTDHDGVPADGSDPMDHDLVAGSDAGDPGAIPGSDPGSGPLRSGPDRGHLAPNLTATFHAMVEDAPPSAVGPLTVLAAARRRRERRARIGGGIVAAAVVVGGFVLLAPHFGAASSSNDSAARVDAASGAVSSAASLSVHPPGVKVPGAVPEYANGGSSSAGSSGAGAAGGGSPAESDTAGMATSAPASAGAPGASAASSAAASSAGPGSGAASGTDSGATTLPRLAPPLMDAAVAALPAGSVTGEGVVDVPAVGAQRSGAVLHMSWGGTVTVVLAVAGGTASSTPHLATLVATATGDGLTVLVAADAPSAARLTQAQLDAVAAAVLGATR